MLEIQECQIPFPDGPYDFLPENLQRKTPHSLFLTPSLLAMGRRAPESVAPSRPSTPPAEQDLDEVGAILTYSTL